MSRRLHVRLETWPLAQAFRISRGAKTEAHVGRRRARRRLPYAVGRGECRSLSPLRRDAGGNARRQIESLRGPSRRGSTARACKAALPPGAARNALDCALWDLEAKQAGPAGLGAGGPRRAGALHHRGDAQPGHAGEHGQGRGRGHAHLPLLKLKVTGEGDTGAHPRGARERARAPGSSSTRTRAGRRPCWTSCCLPSRRARRRDGGAAAAGGGRRGARRAGASSLPLCADESCHTRARPAGASPAATPWSTSSWTRPAA